MQLFRSVLNSFWLSREAIFYFFFQLLLDEKNIYERICTFKNSDQFRITVYVVTGLISDYLDASLACDEN